jgi:arsenite methyltransferase
VSDAWARWLLHRRHGGNEEVRGRVVAGLQKVRDRVLHQSRIGEGGVLLDVGAGDGLIALGATELVGPSGRVIFSDVSQPLLDECRSLATSAGVVERCRFVLAGAEDLGPIEDASVDAVTTRSVLIYVADKARAFGEFFRVLRPGGWISLFEPINRLTFPEPRGELIGLDVEPVADLADRIRETWMDATRELNRPMMDFDDRDLMALAEATGFEEIHLELRRELVWADSFALDWEALLASSPNPLAPTWGEVIAEALTPDEARRFEAHVRSVLESGRQRRRFALATLWARKA